MQHAPPDIHGTSERHVFPTVVEDVIGGFIGESALMLHSFEGKKQTSQIQQVFIRPIGRVDTAGSRPSHPLKVLFLTCHHKQLQVSWEPIEKFIRTDVNQDYVLSQYIPSSTGSQFERTGVTRGCSLSRKTTSASIELDGEVNMWKLELGIEDILFDYRHGFGGVKIKTKPLRAQSCA